MMEALLFAQACHQGQRRKYGGGDYINHPIEVAEIVMSVPHTPEMIAAAYLHDVVEDCGVTREEIAKRFGGDVAKLVHWLTDPPYIGNRASRKKRIADRLARAPYAAQTIKLADMISNTPSIAQNDPKFAPTYLAEKAYLLSVMTGGSPTLRQKALYILKEYT
jgi:(p)ppGpp synthase/HD superfamily hydrolase